MSDVHEINAPDRPMSNKERLKDRELQRAYNSQSELPAVPTKARRRRSGVTLRDLEKQQKQRMESQDGNPDSLPMPRP